MLGNAILDALGERLGLGLGAVSLLAIRRTLGGVVGVLVVGRGNLLHFFVSGWPRK